ncbi:uncharacterized protein LOC130808190 [Amaranthus tricolor]|uniref:uncharacterized protein LOC130808190 n=1 Tax=Amaranthus tricolor TaxID=29722 RepID=UPI00258E3BB2|nr:uncharacterized protein LOC130808190 [Amaranthus tricolor]
MGKVYSICSILMAGLFLVSTSVQFNDPDWYFWIPMYSCAAYVNLKRTLSFVAPKRITAAGIVALWLGMFLLIKVLLEDFFGDMIGIWSLDMRHRLVREKIGSGLVIWSMILQLSVEQDPTKWNSMEIGLLIEFGMTVLVGISCGLSFVFLIYHENEVKY